MSVNSTPRGNSMELAPSFSPMEYFRAEKIECNLPSLFVKKLTDIVEEYFKLKPQLAKKETEMKGLYSYNKKMLQTLQSLMEQQKKVVKKYNKLCHIYVKNFKQYWNSKNVEINFKDLVSPMSSLSEKLNIGEWKVDVEESPPLYANKAYEEMLLTVVKRHYLNEDHFLEKMLQKQLTRVNKESSQVMEAVDIIRSSIRELNTSKPTVATMFDLLQRRKNIEKQILELDDEYYYDIANKDNDFIAEVSRIHNYINNPTHDKLKLYLQSEAQIRRSLRKKNKKYLEGLSSEFQRIQAENTELKQEMQVVKKRFVQLEAQRNDFKNKSSYWQIRASANTKKQKNSSNTSIIEDSIPVGMKDTQKKFQSKIVDLQNQIKNLKLQALKKQEDRKMIEAKKQLQNSNQQLQQLRFKLCHWAFELDYENTSDLTAKGVLDLIYNIYKDEFDEKRKRLKQSKANIQGSQISEFKITNSIPFESLKQVPNIETSPKPFQQSIIIHEPSINEEFILRDNQNNSVGQSEKLANRETEANEIKMTTYQSQQNPTYNIRISSKQSQVVPMSLTNSEAQFGKSKFNYNKSPIPLLSISEKKQAQQQSKMHQQSKFIKDRSVADDRSNANHENSKQAQQLTNFIKHLQEANSALQLQILQLKQHNNSLVEKISEMSRIKSTFEQIERDLKSIEFRQKSMIQILCQNVVTEIIGLQRQQLQQTIDRIQYVLKNKNDILRSSPDNMRSIPILSKNLTEQQDNLFNSQNIMAKLLGVKKQDQKGKNNDTYAQKQKSYRLELHSGQIKWLIKSQKSISLGLKGQPLLTDENLSIMKKTSSKNERNNIIPPEQSSIRIDDDQLIDIVNDFEGTSRRRKQNNSENSLKFSHSNLKGSRDSQIKSSIKFIDKADRRMMQDTQFLLKIQQKIQQIKSNSEIGNELFWFYKKYKQAMQALQITEAKLKQFQIKRQTCMNQQNEENGSLSNNKLQQKIFFLQQRVKVLQQKLLTQKYEYQTNMGEKIFEIDKIKQQLLPKLLKGIFPEQYNFNI